MVHPFLVHFPIALISAGLIIDVTGYILKKETVKNIGWWFLLFGGAGLWLAVFSGLYAESQAVHNEAGHDYLELHRKTALGVSVIFSALLAIRGFLQLRFPQTKTWNLLISAFLLLVGGVMVYAAHLGGKLVYDFGVGTRLGESAQGAAGIHAHSHSHEAIHNDSAGTFLPGHDNDLTRNAEVKRKATHLHADGSRHEH